MEYSEDTVKAILKAFRELFINAKDNSVRRVIRREYEALKWISEDDKDEGWDFISLPLLDIEHPKGHKSMDDRCVYKLLEEINIIEKER